MSAVKTFSLFPSAPYRQHRLLAIAAAKWICTPILLSLATNAWAAPPDAGSLMREEILRDKAPAPLMPPKLDSVIDGKSVTDTGPKTIVTAFRIVGLTAVPEAEATQFLAAFAGQSLSLDGLRRVADKFEQWLRSRGLFAARAYLPPQDIKAGVVEIRVLEGKVEGIDIKLKLDSRLSEDRLRAILAGALPPGGALEQERLERGLLLMNDLPATSARAVLAPGKDLGSSRVVVEAAQGPVMAGSAELDNTGNRFTGDWRLGAALSINDAYGLGDLWSLRAASSQGSTFMRAGYTVPLGSDGWKLGVALIESRYKLCCDATVAALDSNGEASALSGFVSYPLIRTRLTNLLVSANWASRGFVNRSLLVTTSDKTSETVTLGVNGDRSDMVGLMGLGAYTTYSAQWASGRINLDGWAADKAQDATTAQSQGGFDKWAGQVTHLLRLSNTSALYAGLSAQWAGKNLDSSEKFGIGGPQGVRAYPTGEASGDEGWLLSAEWRREINRDWRFVAFADYGEITLHHTPWANWNVATPSLSNRYALSGVGASVVWAPTPASQITASLASRLGKNPARDATGRDSDSRPPRPQLWVQGSLGF
ncbi:MAG: ShlB/FhaC/HecB family hemolysin secretion/activation protein [Rhodocyclaceae bacterium]|nr:MAG: ShlB/FhaC/HecB family hemolysin secretion/activation protein [Rhodocyclaceae bacterium]